MILTIRVEKKEIREESSYTVVTTKVYWERSWHNMFWGKVFVGQRLTEEGRHSEEKDNVLKVIVGSTRIKLKEKEDWLLIGQLFFINHIKRGDSWQIQHED